MRSQQSAVKHLVGCFVQTKFCSDKLAVLRLFQVIWMNLSFIRQTLTALTIPFLQ